MSFASVLCQLRGPSYRSSIWTGLTLGFNHQSLYEEDGRTVGKPTFLMLLAVWKANKMETENVPMDLIYLDLLLDLPRIDYFRK